MPGQGAPPHPSTKITHRLVNPIRTRRRHDVNADAVRVGYDDGDHERFAHYVEKSKIVESAVTGTPVKALCGKVWIPNRDPSKFPICPDCDNIHKGLPRGGDSGKDS